MGFFSAIIGLKHPHLNLRETYVPLESVWERLVRAVKEGLERSSKSLKGSKLRRTSNLTFLKSGLKLHTKKQWSRLSLRTIEYATNTNKKYFYTFRINQITFTYGERKKERPNFYGMFSQNLPNSAVFTAILKLKLSQCNAIGVRTPPGSRQSKIEQQEGPSSDFCYEDVTCTARLYRKLRNIFSETISFLHSLAYIHLLCVIRWSPTYSFPSVNFSNHASSTILYINDQTNLQRHTHQSEHKPPLYIKQTHLHMYSSLLREVS